jgi:hypothetical protein
VSVAGLGPLGVAEEGGMPGADRDARHRDAADLGEHGGGVVAAPPARPGDDEHQVRLGRRQAQLRRQRVRVVRHHGADQGHRAQLAAPRGEHDRVRVGDVAAAQWRADGPDLIAGRDDRDHGVSHDGHRRVTAGRHGGQVAWAQPPPRGHEQFSGREVLTRCAHVPPSHRAGCLRAASSLAGRGGHQHGHQHAPVSLRQQPFPHHHGVRAGRHRVAGVDPLERARGQPHSFRGAWRAEVARAEVCRAHRDPVHGRAVRARRRPAGRDGRRGDPAECLADRDPRNGPVVRPWPPGPAQ